MVDGPAPASPPPGKRRRLHLPIAAVLVAGFGSLMLLAVASVLVLGLVGAGRNTFELLNDKADLALAGVEVRVRHQLDPAAEMAKFVAGLIESGDLDTGSEEALAVTLRGALAAAPQVTGVAFIAADRTGVRVGRVEGKLQTHPLDLRDADDLPDLLNGADRTTPQWSPPTWSPEIAGSFIALFHPVRRNGAYLGQVVAAVSLGDLSRFLSNLYVEQGINAFVLYDREHVLAHSSLVALKFDFAGREGLPLPRIDEVEDQALAVLWTRGQPAESLKKRTEMRTVAVGGFDMLFLMRKMAAYGAQEWTVGIALRMEEADVEIRRLYAMALGGVAILLVSVGVALLAGRRISHRIARLAEAADRVRAFEFRTVPELPDSRLRELSQAATAFNAMVSGLRWFETYVPKALVLRLMHRAADGSGLTSEEREVTVMFTDIRGFSALAEDLGAADTAALLNEHFTQLADCIEAEGGTVDKFIGDAIMAFWGAPEEQHDHAARALRAAHAIADAVHADNRRRTAAGLPPVRVRIGLHSGPVVVGNIGSASRINYTIVGDTVNVAARVEELAARLQGDAEVIVLASAATAARGDGAAPMECIGRHRLRGRTGSAEVWRMLPDGTPALESVPAGDDREEPRAVRS
ncbi:adenylate/guanylate cyclase domain-containing protein [Azospirillum halopraeferens]|uniref:adenylate/guanylate cyclase domain-containing protein n=1 Tax=Azospirillum halopraeferens TaxID=34010 RepID=UPI0003FD6C17|nr:adenylate/guanylate cyclase domain-containing protein [Azospirillum halopraeferens]